MAKKRAKPKFLIYIAVVGLLTLGIYCMKGVIQNFYNIFYEKIISNSGFNLTKIDILGASPRVTKMISDKIGVKTNTAILSISSSEIYNRITNIPWVKQAVVKQNLPNILKIEIKEAKPIAVYQHDTKSILVDRDGKFLEEVSTRPAGVPLVSGLNANRTVYKILDELAKFSDIMAKLDALSYIRERRWDITIAGVKVKLPEENVTDALTTLDTLIKNNKLSKNEVHSVDLRFPGQIILNGLKVRDAKII